MIRFALCLAVFASCAHTPNLPLRPDPTPPPGSTTDTFDARDGTKLFARHWAATGDPKAVVVIMHGLKDHSARYAPTATRLAAGGYSVYAFDLRGHGRSAGPRVSPDRWTDYVDDLDRFLTKIVEKNEPNKPIFLFGHSMGGAIATLTAERHAPKLAGLMLSGPAIAVNAPPLLIAATMMTGATAPSAPALKLPNEDFSSDPQAAEKIANDELVSQPPAPARTAAGLIDGMRQIWEEVDQLTMPILAMHGTADKLTAPAGSRMLINVVPATDKTLKIYEHYYHDLLHEPDQLGKQVEDDMVAWLDAHTGGAAIAPTPMYTGDLDGDPRGRAQAIQITSGVSRIPGVTTSEGTSSDAYKFSGEITINLARPRPVGFHGALTARIFGGYRTVALRPLGVAFRAGAAVLGVSGGIAYTSDKFAISGGGWLELPLGPSHIGMQAEYAKYFSDGHGDTLWTSVALRFGGDRYYWPHARAGVGPVIVGGIGWYKLDPQVYSLTLGLHLYGAD